MENGKVSRLNFIKILPDIEKYVKIVTSTDREPTYTNLSVICEQLKNKMLRPNIAFFKTICDEIEPFLLPDGSLCMIVCLDEPVILWQ